MTINIRWIGAASFAILCLALPSSTAAQAPLVSPPTGDVPFTVQISFAGGIQCSDGYSVSWGDGTIGESMQYVAPAEGYGCTAIARQYTFTHTYTSPGRYVVTLKQGKNLERIRGQTIVASGGVTNPQPYTGGSYTGSTVINASGSSVSQIQAQIQALLAEVNQLQAALRGTGSVSVPVTPLPTVTVPSGSSSNCPLIGRVLRRGSTGDDVSRLQRFLASDSSIYPEGEITGYYGGLTEAAVKRWQTKFNIVSSGDAETTGFGMVGPRTAAAIALQCSTGGSGGTVTPTPTPTPSDGPQVGGFIQVTPVTGIAPHTVSVIATVNTVSSCQAATYTLDWGDATNPTTIAVPAGSCQQMQQTYSHVYVGGGTFIVRLSAGAHSTTATVQVAGPGQQVQQGQQSTSQQQVQSNEIHVTGVIQTIEDARPVDGGLSMSITVGSRDYEVDLAASGQMGSTGLGTMTGFLTGTALQQNVGKTVEVYARRSTSLDPSSYSILADAKYFAKVR